MNYGASKQKEQAEHMANMAAVVCQVLLGYWLISLQNLIKTLFMQAASAVFSINLALSVANEDNNSFGA